MKVKLFFVFLLLSAFVQAQQSKLFAGKNDRGMYLEHKVQPKETWYSVGRLYGISAKDLAAFNELTLEKGLNIDQALRVPLSTSNFSVTTSDNHKRPVYHKVQPKEGLLKIAGLYNTDLETIKKQNKLNSEQINIGFNLIVGYLLTGENPAVVSTTKESVPAQTNEAAKAATVKTETVKQQDPPKQNIPKQEAKAPEKTTTNPVEKNATTLNSFFSAGFLQQSKEGKEQKADNPKYGIFKSSSGWQDAKYYMLMNEVLPGTIVKVIEKESGKAIYAKVLGAVPPGKESEGMQLRLSNAAASALGIQENKFPAIGLVWFK